MPHTAAEADAFLGACRPTLEHLYEMLKAVLSTSDELKARIQRAQDRYDRLSGQLQDTSDWSWTAQFYYSKFTSAVESSRRECEELNDPKRPERERQAAIAQLQATEESIDIVAGSVLQLPKQLLSFRFGKKADVPAGARQVGTQSVVEVIWEGRNHVLHWEEGANKQPVVDMLEKLLVELGADIIAGSNNAVAILEALNWKTADDVEQELRTLVNLA
jgi:hypothetical protein